MNVPESCPIEADVALLTARRALYRFVSVALTDPHAGSWDILANSATAVCVRDAAAIIRSTPEARASVLTPAERPVADLLPVRVLAQLPPNENTLNAQYEATFGLLSAGSCPACETEYVDARFSFQRSQTLADVAGYYYAFGLELANKCRERADHISLEFEFMAALTSLEIRARVGPHPFIERAELCQQAQKHFLQDHLAFWSPTFGRLLERSTGSAFYASLGSFLTALIPVERALLGVDAMLIANGPSAIESPDECVGCPLGT